MRFPELALRAIVARPSGPSAAAFRIIAHADSSLPIPRSASFAWRFRPSDAVFRINDSGLPPRFYINDSGILVSSVLYSEIANARAVGPDNARNANDVVDAKRSVGPTE